MKRRDALKLLAAGGVGISVAGVATRSASRGRMPMMSSSMPAIFLAHGSPFLLSDTLWVDQLHHWATALPAPRSILMVSAHWESAPPTLGATTTVPLVYDFYGFPPSFYETKYPAPGAPALAKRVRELLEPHGPIASAPERGLDHGAYVPLVAMYPEANVPVLQLSLPTMEPKPLFALGRALAPLRQEGVLIVGSGFLIHNLRRLDMRPNAPTPAWAAEFDHWTEEVFRHRDVDALLQYREQAPGVREALPTHEHFVPSIVALGSAIDASPVTFPITGFMAGAMTKRSFQLG